MNYRILTIAEVERCLDHVVAYNRQPIELYWIRDDLVASPRYLKYAAGNERFYMISRHGDRVSSSYRRRGITALLREGMWQCEEGCSVEDSLTKRKPLL